MEEIEVENLQSSSSKISHDSPTNKRRKLEHSSGNIGKGENLDEVENIKYIKQSLEESNVENEDVLGKGENLDEVENIKYLKQSLEESNVENEDELGKGENLDEVENIKYLKQSLEESDVEDELGDKSSLSMQHFKYELPEQASIKSTSVSYKTINLMWPEMGEMFFNQPTYALEKPPTLVKTRLKDFNLKANLLKSCHDKNSKNKLSKLQLEFFNVVADYFDLLFMNRTHENGESLRLIYTIHVLNHILTTRAKIIHHNMKLSKKSNREFRDQGFTQPMAIMLVPFRDDCFQIVAHIMSLMPGCEVMNKKRFVKEFGHEATPLPKKRKPRDHYDTFHGNTGEDFRIGIRMRNKSIHLYNDFYVSDLIIASPLGLRQIIGAEGERDRDYDFLSSIEILIIDKADVLMQQNFHHLLHVLQHFNLLPKESHECNFFRVRMYALNGLAKHYRQTILLSSVEHPWFETIIFRTHCQNYAGYLCTWTNVKVPAICRIFMRMKMCFRWFQASSPEDEMDCRFKFFVTQVLPDFKNPLMSETLIYIPSYFDFVRLRNYFRENELSCAMLCEYTNYGKVAQGRSLFYKGHRHFMLYTERLHFYSRHVIKGIQHIIFYQLPTYPNFFSEMCNSLVHSYSEKKFQEKSCSVLTCKYDLLQLKHIVGLKESKRMNNSTKTVFVNHVGKLAS